jgi:hypothetical protein
MQVTTEAMPTQGGEYCAYAPEWFSGDKSISPDGWQRIHTTTLQGVPGIPASGGSMPGINHTVGLFTQAAANALAWQYAACVEARDGRAPEVRVIGYRVKYDIKCYRELEQS